MDDDTFMNDVDKEIQTNAEAYASFDFSFKSDAITTKSSSSYSGEEAPGGVDGVESLVNNCYLAVFNNATGKLISSTFYNYTDLSTGSDGNTALSSHFSFKVSKEAKPNLKFVAIVNVNSVKQGSDYETMASLEKLQEKTTYSDLMATEILEDPTVLVKVGEYVLNAGDYKTSSSLSKDHDSFCKTVVIPVCQRSAAVELSSFTVKTTTGDVLKATDVRFILYNVNVRTKVDEASNKEEYVSNPYESAVVGVGERLYTYENTTSKKAYIIVSYKVNGIESKTTPLSIKTPVDNQLGYDEKVLANHLYKLNVTVTNGVASADCTVGDWISNPVSGEWTEVNK